MSAISDLQLQLTITVGELAQVAALIDGAIGALEGVNEEVPPIYYEIVAREAELQRELGEAVADLFGVE